MTRTATNVSTPQIGSYVDQLANTLATDDPQQIEQAIAALAWDRKANRHTIAYAIEAAGRPTDPELLAQTIQGAHHS